MHLIKASEQLQVVLKNFNDCRKLPFIFGLCHFDVLNCVTLTEFFDSDVKFPYHHCILDYDCPIFNMRE